jgi:iron complex transport system permease protein
LGFSGATWFALAGCALSLFIVYGLTMARVGYSSAAMLLCGVAAGFFFSSLIMMIQYLSDFSQSYRIIRWLMGGVNVVGFQEVVPLVLTTLLGSLILFWWAPPLNLLLCGPEQAHSRGLNVNHARNVLFVVTSIMVGVVVSLCGPIGFVGLMMPHFCRMLLGVDHRLLLPGSFLLGGVFLTWCDVLARTLIAPAEIPVGILTALCGGPFFFWLLTRPKTGLAL